jgi:4-hydroxy-tetrahydrodipicolinate synthase
MEKFKGVFTALITPFKNGAIDYQSLEKLVQFQIQNGVDGFVINGTTAESPNLSHQEIAELFKKVKSWAPKSVLIMGTGSNSTAKTIEDTKKASELGADAVLVVVPYYNKPSQEGMYQHFKAVAESVDLPIVLYNIKGRTGVNMETDTLLRLAEIKNIVGMKEASGDLKQIKEVIDRTPKEFLVYSGDDGLTLEVMKLGGDGVISVASHIVGPQIKKVLELSLQKKFDEAAKLDLPLQDLYKVLFITSNPVPLKAAMQMMGFNAGGVRLPLVSANENERKQIEAVLAKLGILTKA